MATYEERSFTAAAVREHATQPGVSHHVRHLEESLHVQLFVRDKGILTPTPAGDRYYQHCLKVMLAYEESISAMREFACAHAETFTVGLIPSLTRHVLAPALSNFKSRSPNVKIKIVEAYSPSVIDKVSTGECDFGIASEVYPVDGLQVDHLFDSAQFLVRRQSANKHDLEDVELRSVGPLKLVVPWASNANVLVLQTYIRDSEAQVRETLEVDSFMGTLDLVARSDWSSILPGMGFCQEDLQIFHLQRIVRPDYSFKVYVVSRPDYVFSTAAKMFVDELSRIANTVMAKWSAAAIQDRRHSA